MSFELASGPKGKKKHATPDMNVTPLVDVVLVLLIIFMVITPLLAKQFWVHVPRTPDEAPSAPITPDKSIVVTVRADGEIRINREVVALAELSPRLTRILSASQQRTVFFDAAADAPYGTAVAVLDQVRAGGGTTIAVSPQPLAD